METMRAVALLPQFVSPPTVNVRPFPLQIAQFVFPVIDVNLRYCAHDNRGFRVDWK